MNSELSTDPVVIIRGRSIWRIENALIEEVNPSNRWSGNIIISYNMRGSDGLFFKEKLQLNITPRTIIRNKKGTIINIGNLQVLMRINADFLPFLSSENPSAANVLRIIVRQSEQPAPPQPLPPQGLMITDRIVNINLPNNFITVGVPNDIYKQNIFNINDNTVITDRNGRTIPVRGLRIGQLIEVNHSLNPTFSTPPQSTAFSIRVLQ